MELPTAEELAVRCIGLPRVPSPLAGRGIPFVDEARRVLLCDDLVELETCLAAGGPPPTFEPAGPRREICFDPHALSCGIVTCGGVCPGVNSVIRSVVRTLTFAFGVHNILGFRYGFAGLTAREGHEPLPLTPEVVDRIHEHGGTILGSSRGPQDIEEMVDTLVNLDIGLLFAIGGDGTQRGAHALCEEIDRRGLRIGVIGIPKTIDNDLQWTESSFGFATAVEAARGVVVGAHEEARSVWNGIGMVKLMGRHSGFIAAHASMANSDVNYCLIPEVPFVLGGRTGFLHALERRLREKHHALIVVAEGAGQDLMHGGAPPGYDASGNVRLKDVGVYLKRQIEEYFAEQHQDVSIKYMDPSYAIRSLPANAVDAEFCLALGQHAVYAGMGGRTDMIVGFWRRHFTHVPSVLATRQRRQIDPQGELWQRVLEATGQPPSLGRADCG